MAIRDPFSVHVVVSNSKTLLFSHSPLRLAMAGHPTLQLLVYPWYHDRYHHQLSHSPASLAPCKIGLEKQLNAHNMPEELQRNNKFSQIQLQESITIGGDSFRGDKMNKLIARIQFFPNHSPTTIVSSKLKLQAATWMYTDLKRYFFLSVERFM